MNMDTLKLIVNIWCGNRVYILSFIITHFIIIHLSFIFVIIIFNLKLGLVRVCTRFFSFPSSAWPPSHTLRRPAPTGAAMATFRLKATFRKLGGGGGGYVATGPNLSISNRCNFDRFFRVTTCQQPRRLLHVSSRRRHRSASEHVLPAASGQTTLLSARLDANPARLGLLISISLYSLLSGAVKLHLVHTVQCNFPAKSPFNFF